MTSLGDSTNFANNADLQFADFGQFRTKTMTDTSIFDLYNHLLEGPNKGENQEWDHYDISLAQTYLDNNLGWELTYDKQDYFESRHSFITGGRQAIMVDTNSVRTDQVLLPESEQTENPNPDAGRPFITDSQQFGNSLADVERDAIRFTAFAQHDFTETGDDSWWRRLRGRQRFTGLYSEDELDEFSVNWQRWTMGQDFRDFVGVQDITDNVNAINGVIYLDESLLGMDSLQGANIQGAKTRVTIPDQVSARVWDDTWIADGVDPGAWWDDNGNGVQEDGETQSENPANYVGWTNREFSVDKATADNPDPLATGGALTTQEVESEALILQNYFWNGGVVGTYGWRKDTATGASKNHTLDPDTQRALIRETEFEDGDFNEVEGQTQSWSIVAHLNQLGLDEFLPIDVSLYYNESENFQPAATRVDMFGRSLKNLRAIQTPSRTPGIGTSRIRRGRTESRSAAPPA